MRSHCPPDSAEAAGGSFTSFMGGVIEDIEFEVGSHPHPTSPIQGEELFGVTTPHPNRPKPSRSKFVR